MVLPLNEKKFYCRKLTCVFGNLADLCWISLTGMCLHQQGDSQRAHQTECSVLGIPPNNGRDKKTLRHLIRLWTARPPGA